MSRATDQRGGGRPADAQASVTAPGSGSAPGQPVAQPFRPEAPVGNAAAASGREGPVVARELSGSATDAAAPRQPEHDRPDEMLLSAHRAGDRRAFGELVGRYQRELFHFLVRFMGDRTAAEDVFQETFLQVYQSIDQFDPTRRFRPWLFTIAANKARDLMRSQSRRPTTPLQASINNGDEDSGEFVDLMGATQALPGESMEREELQSQVHRAVMSMPEHLREILLLSYFHQFPYKQISDILEIPLGTVKSRLHAAVAHFADRWRATNRKPSAS